MTHPQELIDAARNALISGLKGGESGKRGVFANQSVAAAIDAVRKWDAEHPPTPPDAMPVPELIDAVAKLQERVETVNDDANIRGLMLVKDTYLICERLEALEAALADALGKDGE